MAKFFFYSPISYWSCRFLSKKLCYKSKGRQLDRITYNDTSNLYWGRKRFGGGFMGCATAIGCRHVSCIVYSNILPEMAWFNERVIINWQSVGMRRTFSHIKSSLFHWLIKKRLINQLIITYRLSVVICIVDIARPSNMFHLRMSLMCMFIDKKMCQN